MEEKYKKFLEFKWHESADWQLYYSNLSQIPTPDKVQHFKKRFYKLKIDSDFDTKWEAPSTTNTASGSSNTDSNNTYRSNFNPNYSYNAYPSAGFSINSPLLAGVEAAFWVGFLISIIVPYYTLKIAALAILLRVIRRTGKPQFNMEYAQVLFLDEHFQMLLYAVLLMIDRLNYFTIVPIAMTAVLNTSEYVKSNPVKLAPVLPYANKILNKRVQLAQMRANVEIAIGFLLVVGIFFGLSSFILPIFYWQYLRFKYIVNNDLKLAFTRLNLIVSDFKAKPAVPSPVKFLITKIQDFASYLGRTEPAPGQAAGGANCSIF